MKVLDLRCRQDHAFEGWFGSEADFQDQLQRGLLECPLCGDAQVRKVLSAPRLNLGSRERPGLAAEVAAPNPNPVPQPVAKAGTPASALQAAWLQWARKIAAQTEDVGPRFADEARRMHHGDTPERAIRGQASVQETAQLLQEGIAVLPLPAAATETLQ